MTINKSIYIIIPPDAGGNNQQALGKKLVTAGKGKVEHPNQGKNLDDCKQNQHKRHDDGGKLPFKAKHADWFFMSSSFHDLDLLFCEYAIKHYCGQQANAYKNNADSVTIAVLEGLESNLVQVVCHKLGFVTGSASG